MQGVGAAVGVDAVRAEDVDVDAGVADFKQFMAKSFSYLDFIFFLIFSVFYFSAELCHPRMRTAYKTARIRYMRQFARLSVVMHFRDIRAK